MVSNGAPAFNSRSASERMDWADYAKGVCIIMVVMMHSTLGVEAAADRQGFMHAVVEFAKPFRMPDFFLISGLFLSRVIDRDLRTYLDRKVVHFAYFYGLWVTIQFAFKAPGMAMESGLAQTGIAYLESFIEPFGTLWFIYLLPIFFVVTRLTRALPPAMILSLAAALEMASIKTGWTVPDEFAARFVYFYSGYLFARWVFTLVAWVQHHPSLAIAGLVLWAIVNAVLVEGGFSTLPVISLALGFAGAGAIIAIGALLAKKRWLAALRYCGENSIVIYLAFFLPMAATRVVLLRTHLIADIGLISLIVTVAGVIGALAIWWATRGTSLKFLFERPHAFWLTPKPSLSPQPAQ